MVHTTLVSTLANEASCPPNKFNPARKRGRSVAHIISPGAKARLAAELHLGRVAVEALTVPQAAGIVGAPIASVYAALTKIRREERMDGRAPNGHAKQERHLRDQVRRLVRRNGFEAVLDALGEAEKQPSFFDQ